MVTRKPPLWIGLAIVAVAATAFSWSYFPEAFPLVSLDIRMDRQAALSAARELATKRRLGPAAFREAASFSLDEEVQTFVELEGGGKSAFATLVADRLASPYHWRVRHFNERDANEITFSFAPDGTPNGFVEHLPENAPGPALDAAAVREIAESTARRDWNVDLSVFQSVEQSQNRRTGGRIDHTFVYERPDRQMGEGRYRLRLVVGGDRLTALDYFIRIPEAFSRRYEEMRSVNTAIGIAGSLAFLVIYGVGGIAIGLFVLGRLRWVIWRQPIFWGCLVALAQTAATINEWPLAWMQYDTALSTQSFFAQQASAAVLELMANAALLSLSFMAAESLTRRAFPSHPQFWRIWSGPGPSSPAIAGRTAAGYLLVPMFIAYEVALYLYATKLLGWWTPSEALFNPDVLASYVPWYSAVAKSLQAGFWEEALFRALPLAGAALIGDRFGHRRWWIVGAFVVQAAIFGAGHAPYPTQPAYARPVELVIPSIGFGLLYLFFGLLPGIILHFTFDAFWFSMPIFASSAAGSHLQQAMLVVVVLIPAWIVIARRLTRHAEDVERNADWQPPAQAAPQRVAELVEVGGSVQAAHVRWVLIAGVLSLAIWVAAMIARPLRDYQIESSRQQAAQAARTALASAQLGTNWRFLPAARDGGGDRHRFVLETGGPSVHDALLGSYLDLPGWLVSVRTFEGDVAERAESWDVYLDGSARVERIAHELPESRAGASLDEAAARALAYRAFHDRFALDESSLDEISASPAKRPQRTDWTITVKDTSQHLPSGEARLSAEIAGDEIADLRRFVFVPEEWERTERNAATRSNVIQGAGIVLPVLTLIGGVVGAMISWSRRQFAVWFFPAVGAAFLLFGLMRFVNSFPSLMAALSTSQPLQLQLMVLIATGTVGITLQSAAMGLVAGGVPVWARGRGIERRSALQVGIALGLVGAAARILSTLPGGERPWPSYDGAATFMPFLSAAFDPVVVLLARTVFLTLVVAAANHLSAMWTKQRVPVGTLIVLIAGVLGNAGSPRELPVWIGLTLLIGVLFLVAYVFVLRHDVSLVPLAAAVMTGLGALREGLAAAYPSSLAGAIVSIAVMLLIAGVWYRALAARRPAHAADRDVS
jgi:Type II CAAX prenyl endopeptidase Rce1-like